MFRSGDSVSQHNSDLGQEGAALKAMRKFSFVHDQAAMLGADYLKACSLADAVKARPRRHIKCWESCKCNLGNLWSYKWNKLAIYGAITF